MVCRGQSYLNNEIEERENNAGIDEEINPIQWLLSPNNYRTTVEHIDKFIDTENKVLMDLAEGRIILINVFLLYFDVD